MTFTAIELLFIGNSASEIDSYIKVLRNAGKAVHFKRIEHDYKALESVLQEPVDSVILTREKNALGIEQVQEIRSRLAPTTPLIILADAYEHALKTELMSQGACDLVERHQPDLLTQVLEKQLAQLYLQRELQSIRTKLQEAEQRCHQLTESSKESILYSVDGMIVHANPACLSMFRFMDQEEINGLPILELITSEERNTFKKVLKTLSADRQKLQAFPASCLRADGSIFKAELELLPAMIDGEPAIQLFVHNPQTSQELERKLYLLSTQDTQTGLFNRQHFIRLLDDYLHLEKSPNSSKSLLYITLDKFSDTRADIGISGSDEVILGIAGILRNNLSEGDILARFGDHTFTLLTSGNGDNPVRLAEEIQQQISTYQYEQNAGNLHVTCSLGILRLTPQVSDANALVGQAYLACEQARIKGGNQIHLVSDWNIGNQNKVPSEAELDLLIDHALSNNRFRLVYQPIVSLHGDTHENYAVLVRLLDKSGEEIHPDYFLPQIEKLKRTNELDQWVIHHAIQNMIDHRKQGKKFNFFINISAASIEDNGLLLWICDCLAEFEAKGSWFTFQFNYADVCDHLPEMKMYADGLKKIKCRISIDHFDLNDRSKSCLSSKLPIDLIQFDEKLIAGLDDDEVRQDRLNDLNQYIQDSHIKTIACGIENPNSLALLWSIGVNYIRGYYVHEPDKAILHDLKQEAAV